MNLIKEELLCETDKKKKNLHPTCLREANAKVIMHIQPAQVPRFLHTLGGRKTANGLLKQQNLSASVVK